MQLSRARGLSISVASALGIAVIAGSALLLSRSTMFEAAATSNQPQIPAPLLGTPVVDAQLLAASTGWALTGKTLEITTDGGASWADITPPGVAPDTIRAVDFTDSTHGLLLTTQLTGSSSDPRGQLVVYRTTDAGQTWQSADVGDPTPDNVDAETGPASFDFLSNQTGWLSVSLASSSAFSRGLLFSTTDGGASWRERTIPIGAPVAFATPDDGWTAGGVGDASAFVTHDGGSTWQQLRLPTPTGLAESAAYGIPSPHVGPADAISATYPDGRVVWFTTSDDGQSFAATPPAATGGNFDGGVGLTSGQAAGTVVSVFPPAGRVLWEGGGSSPAVETATGLPSLPDAAASSVTVASNADAWVVLSGSSCLAKVSCTGFSGLFSTDDSGLHWTQLHP